MKRLLIVILAFLCNQAFAGKRLYTCTTKIHYEESSQYGLIIEENPDQVLNVSVDDNGKYWLERDFQNSQVVQSGKEYKLEKVDSRTNKKVVLTEKDGKFVVDGIFSKFDLSITNSIFTMKMYLIGSDAVITFIGKC